MATKALAKSLGLIYKPQEHKQAYPKKRPQIFDYLIVLDFEATCWENKITQPQKGEIIEFPAVLMNTADGKIEETFHHYVMPTQCSTLTDFCKNLTGISQETVNAAVPLAPIMKLFGDWVKAVCEPRSLVINPAEASDGNKSATFVTWSDWDLGIQLFHECLRKSLFRNSHFNAWIDLRLVYRTFYKSKPVGLNGALEERGLMFAGREHSGIDDAKNTARLAFKMITDGCCFRVTKSLQGKPVLSLKPKPIVKPTAGQFINPNHVTLSTSYRPPSVPSNTTVTAPLCKCGKPSARKSTSNGGPNHGRHYFSCKGGRGSSCGFYIWESAVKKRVTLD